MAIVKSKDRDALVTGRSTGHPIRSLKNQFSREFINLEKSGAHIEELANLNVGRLKLAVKTGDIINEECYLYIFRPRFSVYRYG